MHEPILYGWPLGNTHAYYGDRSQTSIWRISKDDVNSYAHPTQKPVALIEKAVNNSSKSGDSVLDLFGGSGSTLMACEKTARSARLIELDPKYCDVIVKRWQDFTGKEAVLESDGRTFNEVVSERQPDAPKAEAKKKSSLPVAKKKHGKPAAKVAKKKAA